MSIANVNDGVETLPLALHARIHFRRDWYWASFRLMLRVQMVGATLARSLLAGV